MEPQREEIIEAPRLLALNVMPFWWGLVPLRKANKSIWARVRKTHLANHPPVCEICSAVHEACMIEAHEVYSYVNPAFVQLERVEFLCYRCHRAIHLERTQRCYQPPHVKEIIEHYCRINGGLSAQDVKQDLTAARNRSRAIQEFYKGAYPAVPSKNRNRRVKAKLQEEFIALSREWMTAPPIDYGPFQHQFETSQQRKQVWPRTYAGQMHIIRSFLALHSRKYDEKNPGKGNFHPDYDDDVVEASEQDANIRATLVGHLHARNHAAAHSAICILLADRFDPDDEFLTDHEVPWATAMWRDTLG